jgi:electron transport complex protein RnfG
MLKNMILSALLLGLFAVVGTFMVAFTAENTAERIARNEREALLENLHALVPPQRHTNDIFEDRITVQSPLLGTAAPVPVYRARKDGEPVAAVLSPVAPEGYSGDIRLLVAINYDGTLAGVRVLSHRETPGLGDKIEASRSDWILGFKGKSLANPQPNKWAVEKDGGVFDQFTGATITPRAVVSGVYNTLRYFKQHRDELFAEPAMKREQPNG